MSNPEPEPTPAQANRAPRRAWSDVRSAIIGAIAAAVITGVLGYFGMYQQIQAEDDRAVKERQQVVYSALISDQRTLDRLEENFFRMYVSRQPAAELTAQKRLADEAYLKLSQDVSNVALVGSRAAAATALNIELYHARTSSAILGAEHGARSDILNDDIISKVAEGYYDDPRMDALYNLTADFIEHGRRDLGTQ